MSNLPRGIRNNNPGNIIKSSINWLGMAPLQSDSRFVVFKEFRYGVRAMLLNMINQIKNGHNTVRRLISRWAPPSENNTENYIQFVSKQTGLNPDMPIPLNKEILYRIANAITIKENGVKYPLSRDDFENGFSLLPKSATSIITTAGASLAALAILILTYYLVTS